MPRSSALAILFSLLGSGLAAAQECRGFAPFQRQPIHLLAGALLGNQSTAYAAGMGFGNSFAFGEVELGAIDTEPFSTSSRTVGWGVGVQLPNEHRTAYWCPFVQLLYAKGPKDLFALGSEYSKNDFSLGLSVGIMANGTTHQVEFIPTGSVAYSNAKSKFTSSSGVVTGSNSQPFGVVSLGVGVVFGRVLTITPSLSRAVFVSGGSTTVGIRLAFAIGHGRPTVIASRPSSCVGLASTDSAVYDTTQVAERATLRSASELRYPPMEKELDIGGRVIMTVVVGPDGSIEESSVQIAQHVDPGIDREALRWIGTATYWPACRDGRPVRARLVQPLDFCVAGCRQGKS